ncbi:hypothetical protein BH10ACT7_BH10ACT7_05560 [soil metagenome]
MSVIEATRYPAALGIVNAARRDNHDAPHVAEPFFAWYFLKASLKLAIR